MMMMRPSIKLGSTFCVLCLLFPINYPLLFSQFPPSRELSHFFRTSEMILISSRDIFASNCDASVFLQITTAGLYSRMRSKGPLTTACRIVTPANRSRRTQSTLTCPRMMKRMNRRTNRRRMTFDISAFPRRFRRRN